MSNYIVFNTASGEILRGGEAPGELIPLQAGDGETSIEVPRGVLSWPDLDLELYRQHLYVQIDASAELVRTQFITPGSGQAMTYLKKEAEAAAYLADNTVPTPFLSAEATATGVTLPDLAALVNLRAQQWGQVGPIIEGTRLGAKKAVETATDIASIYQASVIDWVEVLS